jgi:hypothetical protein
MNDRQKLEYGSSVTAATKLGIARSLLAEANAALRNDKIREAIALVTKAIEEVGL